MSTTDFHRQATATRISCLELVCKNRSEQEGAVEFPTTSTAPKKLVMEVFSHDQRDPAPRATEREGSSPSPTSTSSFSSPPSTPSRLPPEATHPPTCVLSQVFQNQPARFYTLSHSLIYSRLCSRCPSFVQLWASHSAHSTLSVKQRRW